MLIRIFIDILQQWSNDWRVLTNTKYRSYVQTENTAYSSDEEVGLLEILMNWG